MSKNYLEGYLELFFKQSLIKNMYSFYTN